MRKNLLLALTCVLLFTTALFAQADKKEKKVLKNADIVLMTQNHFDDETLTKIIEVSDTDFDISGDALIDLNNKGVSPAVLRAMLQAMQNKKQAVQPSAATPPAASSTSSTPATPP